MATLIGQIIATAALMLNGDVVEIFNTHPNTLSKILNSNAAEFFDLDGIKNKNWIKIRTNQIKKICPLPLEASQRQFSQPILGEIRKNYELQSTNLNHKKQNLGFALIRQKQASGKTLET